MGLDELQYNPIDNRPQRLHQIEDEWWATIAVRMQITNRGFVAFSSDLDPHLAFEHRVGVIQDCVDRM